MSSALIAACEPAPIPPMRLWTRDLAIQVSANPVPPPAREPITFTVVVRDKTSGQPIQNGEGQIYATSSDGVNAWDGLTPARQPGTYTGRLEFITSGDWAMGLRFRRDSTQALQTMDWRQEVMAERPDSSHIKTP